MCCLFGLVDYRHSLTQKQKNHILAALATASEARGTDSTGIAYNAGGALRIYKRPLPGHLIRFRVPRDASVVMGHTRLATQGSARKNRNNHPFLGSTSQGPFALAHNGVIYNDDHLRYIKNLPQPKIETDSFIGVQLIEQRKTLDFSSLKYMAEQVRGSFSFTVLDQSNTLYVVKGDSPFCLYHFPAHGVYVYASTEEILRQALSKVRFPLKGHRSLHLQCGEIIRIGASGKITRRQFDDSNLFYGWRTHLWPSYRYPGYKTSVSASEDYLEELKSVAMAFGYAPEEIENLSQEGFSPEELEEFLYCGQI